MKRDRAAARFPANWRKKFSRRCLRAASTAAVIIEREGLKQISDTGELERVIEEVIAQNPKQVEQYRGGKTTRGQFPGGPGDAGHARPGERGGGHANFQTQTRRRGNMLKEGDQAPEIDLETDTGENFRLSDLKGQRVVLYFYPKADTPGCTTESCEFRDDIPAIQEKGAR